MDDEKEKRRKAREEPRPDWWWEIKKDRPWVIIHVEDGPPLLPPMPAEIVEGDDDNYFQPRWLDHVQSRAPDDPSAADTQPSRGLHRPRHTFSVRNAKAADRTERDGSD